MRLMKVMLWQVVTLGALLALGCSGGGGGGGTAPPTSMKEVSAPADAGVVGGFVYASVQHVAVDIVVPAEQLVTIYDRRPANSAYDASGIWITNPTMSKPVALASGMSVLNTADNTYHYKTTITVPTSASTVYVIANFSAIVNIAAGKISATITREGQVI